MLTGLTPRTYQTNIFREASSRNALVVLPTGLGKTAIAMMLAARRLLLYPDSKILILAPTKPLVEQHAMTFRDALALSEDEFAVFTGTISPSKRHEAWSTSKAIFSTPQALENDVLGAKISLSDVSLLVIDEAHRATGDYAYVFLADEYHKTASHERILGLTASPGTDKETIREVCNNLFIRHIEYRTPDDRDVKPYTNPTSVSWDKISLPEFLDTIISYLTNAYKRKLSKMNALGFLSHPPSSYTKGSLLKLQRHLQSEITKGDRTPELFSSVSLLAQALKLQHAIELAETQTINALYSYQYSVLSDARSSRSKALKELSVDPDFLAAFSLTRSARQKGEEHPKLFTLTNKLAAFLNKHEGAKIIIFTQFRDTAQAIQKSLPDSISSNLFFGQTKKDGVGFSQKRQKEVLERFRNDEFSVLIATSVAEEGLDIPNVDHVFFYEPIPSAIRSVQRRGRTGRHGKGNVTVLLAEGTRDETFRWVSFHKEKRMFKALEELQQELASSSFSDEISDSDQRSLSSFPSSDKPTHPPSSQPTPRNADLRIVADFREKGSQVLKSLRKKQEVSLELKQLQVGDFVLSPYCCVEFKHVSDFVDSIVDGRILTQIRSLVQYPHPVLIVEGSEDEFNSRKVDPEAIAGMMSTIALSYRVPIIRTSTPMATASMITMMAKQEQQRTGNDFTFHTAKPLNEKS
ncbi:MAG: ERCC4 domain-containing protein, partial [Nanoarchaeota archaeon]